MPRHKAPSHLPDGRQPTRRDRGSRHRVERITLRGNWSVGIIIFALFLLAFFLAVPWMARRAADRHAPRPPEVSRPR